MARVAYVCASLMLVLFSAGLHVALGRDVLLSVLDGAEQGSADLPSAISLGVSTVLALCVDVAMLYAASMLRLLGVRRAEPRAMRLHREIMATLAVLEAGTYAMWRGAMRPCQCGDLGAQSFSLARSSAALALPRTGASSASNRT
jgi:hypothetical protein